MDVIWITVIMISLIKPHRFTTHGYVVSFFRFMALYLCVSSLTVAEEVKTEDQLIGRISYVQAAFFDVSYYKERHELESKHHGDIDPDNPVMTRATQQLDQGIINFRMMLENVKSDKISLTDESRIRVLEGKIATATGSRLIAIFEYVRWISKKDYDHLKKYFINLAEKYEKADEPLYNGIYLSWKNNRISIPANDKNGEISWRVLTPLEYIEK